MAAFGSSRMTHGLALAGVVVLLALGGLWLARAIVGHDVVDEIPEELLDAAAGGDPEAISQVWWIAYWSGRPDVFVPLTDPDIVSTATLTQLVGHSQFHAALNPGGTPLGVGACESAVGFNEVRLLCDVLIIDDSDGYRWDPGRRQSFTSVIRKGRVSSVSFDGYHLDGTGAVPEIIALAEATDEAAFIVACTGDPGGYEVYDEPAEFFALRDEIVAFTDFVVDRECGEFLRHVLDGAP